MSWMHATHPKMAKRWTKEQEKEKGKKSFKKLPEKAKKRRRDDQLEITGWDILSDECIETIEGIK